jgi:hypothetical protein
MHFSPIETSATTADSARQSARSDMDADEDEIVDGNLAGASVSFGLRCTLICLF